MGELVVRGRGRQARGVALRPAEALAIAAVTAMVLTDLTLLPSRPLRDLGIYLRAGDNFMHGAPVYITSLYTAHPADPTTYPFLYPPLTLPLFAVLAALPFPVVAGAWLMVSVGAALWAMRAFGLSWRLASLLLLWPPLAQGLFVGNVAVPALALFAAGPWLGEGLVAGAIFKLYTGLLALWLVAERRWRSIVAGIAVVAAIGAATLPLVGSRAWSDWLHALDLYRSSQPLLPAYLYGISLARVLPAPAFIGIGLVVLVAAFRGRGLDRLARLGVATIVVSPSLFGHGFVLAIPALFALGEPWAWLALGLMSTGMEAGLWLGLGLAVVAWFLPSLRAGGRAPWPASPPSAP